MTRQERLQAIADYFRWTEVAVLGHLLTREASLEAYADYLELEELREFKERHSVDED